MINPLFLASYGVGTGGAVGNFLFELESMGVFAYVLPFLMIFAIVYAILTKVRIVGDNNAINVVLSLSVSLMALQFNFVSYFFAEIFPRMGVLLSVIVTAIILLGLFLDFDKKGTKFVVGAIAFIGFIIILVQSFDIFGYGGGTFGLNGYWWWFIQDHLSALIVGFFVIAFIIAIVKPRNSSSKKKFNLNKMADHFATDE